MNEVDVTPCSYPAGVAPTRAPLGILFTVIAGLIGTSTMADTKTLAEPGDVLEVSVLEDPSLGREARINVNGTIMLPRLDEIDVAGQDLGTIRASIASELQERGIIRTPTVIVEFASYRPFYVGGAVAKPGAIPFEPGLTVRHALILAGGLDADADEDVLAPEALDELRSKLRLTSYELLQSDSLIARLTAELRHNSTADFEGLDQGLVAEEDAESIRAIDSDVLSGRANQWAEEEAHRRMALDLIEAEIEILQQQAALEQQEQEIQTDELQNARRLVEQGVMPQSQLRELEREASQISRSQLDSQAYAARARQQREEAEHRIRSAETEWRLDIQERLRAAAADRVRLRSEMEALTLRLLSFGLAMDESGALVRPTPEITIYRSGASGTETFRADLGTGVLPGDILDVVLTRPPEG